MFASTGYRSYHCHGHAEQLGKAALKLGRAIDNIQYTSFKGGVKDKCRAWFYTRVWSITADMQDACEELRETGSPVI